MRRWEKYAWIFALGGVAGWVLELIVMLILGDGGTRVSYLNLPFIPLYGVGALILYWTGRLKLWEPLKIVLLGTIPTVLELVTGVFLIDVLGTRLWDYTAQSAWHYRGVISIETSIAWAVLAVFSYYIIFPRIGRIIGR